MKRIVILGGGCGGLSVARALRFVHCEITLVDRADAHLSTSKLYAAVTAEPRGLQVPLTRLLRAQKNVQVVVGDAVYLDARKRRVILADRALPYDTLVVATGSRSRYERDTWQRTAPGLKSAADAERIREKLSDKDTSVVVVGGGVAGVELAGALARGNRTRIATLIESGPRVLSAFPESLAREAAQRLEKLGVEIRCGLHAIGMDAECIRVSGSQGRERILSRAVLWAGGVEGSGFGAALESEAGAQRDDAGRISVNADLSVPGHPEIFVIGDLARVLHEGDPLPGLATVAAQQGRWVAAAIRERMAGYDARPFEYVDQGRFAVIGRGGVGVLGEASLRGTVAWLASRVALQWSAPRVLPSLQAYSAATGSRT